MSPATRSSISESRVHRAEVVARRLAELRREHGLSQDAVGSLVGASQATVSRWEDPESQSSPSALELAELAEHFSVDVAWIVGSRDHRQELPVGQALVDQPMLDKFTAAKDRAELKRLLSQDMAFGAPWVQIPAGAEVVSIEEALRRVKAVDRQLRRVYPDLWHEWAEIVLS